jgi:L-lactate dehydrogenase complex protein LldF
MSFPAAAREALGDAQLRRNMGKATSAIRARRSVVVDELDDWEALRDAGAAIKERALATLPEQLATLEASVTRAGGTVHWARDGAEASSIIAGIVNDHGAREVIKVKSLATDEISLNEALARAASPAIETDCRADRAARRRRAVAHPRSGDPPQPAEIAALFERTIAQGQQLGLEPRRSRGRAPAPAREVPVGAGRGRAARTSASPRRARSASWSPRATGACAPRCPTS